MATRMLASPLFWNFRLTDAFWGFKRAVMSALDVTSAPEQVEEAVRCLLNEAKELEYIERRFEPRFPFFHPATLTYRYRPEQPISVFTRELSNSGIGLLHAVPLERGEVAVTVLSRGRSIIFRTYILWCKPCGDWHLSGGQFLGMAQS
jgi:hypothetical protein